LEVKSTLFRLNIIYFTFYFFIRLIWYIDWSWEDKMLKGAAPIQTPEMIKQSDRQSKNFMVIYISIFLM
jgi:hypothetical protein